MAKTATAASKRRGAAESRKRHLKRSKKKAATKVTLPKQGVLGKVNGFTVTRLEPEKLKLTRIFPECSPSPATEVKRVTFAWAEPADQSNESRTHRASTRRTHSARDSSEDSLNDFDASREPKRRRTIESDVVEDAEIRKATSSMRHCKASLQHSTPADILDNSCSTSKRVFPRTPKPTDKKSASPNDTFEENTYDEEGGEGYSEPKVSLASLFDEETHVEENGNSEGLLEMASAAGTQDALKAGCGERTSLNSDDTTVDLEAAPSVSLGLSRVSESKSLNESSDVTPVRVLSKKLKDVSKEVAPQEATAKKASRVSDTASQEGELILNLVEVADAADEPEADSSAKNPHRGTKSVSPTRDDSYSALDERSISLLSRRNSEGNNDPREVGDVFKQRRSQLSLDEEEPMEISGMQMASRLSNAPTPRSTGKCETVIESDEVPSSVAVDTVRTVPTPDRELATTTTRSVDAQPEQGVIDAVAIVAEAATVDAAQQDPPVGDTKLEPNSDQRKTAFTFSKQSLSATFDEDDDVELQRLSLRIKILSERDETMESPKPKPSMQSRMPREDVVAAPDAVTLSMDSKVESSSRVANPPQVEFPAVVEANLTNEAPPISTPLASEDSHEALSSVHVKETSSQPDVAARVETPPISDAIPSEVSPSISDALPSEVVTPKSDVAPSEPAPSISDAVAPAPADPNSNAMAVEQTAPIAPFSPSDGTLTTTGDAAESNEEELEAEGTQNLDMAHIIEGDGQRPAEIVETLHDSKNGDSSVLVDQNADSNKSPDGRVSPPSESVGAPWQVDQPAGAEQAEGGLCNPEDGSGQKLDQGSDEKCDTDEAQIGGKEPTDAGEPVAEDPSDNNSMKPPQEVAIGESTPTEESVEPTANLGEATELHQEDTETETESTTSGTAIDLNQSLEGRERRVRRVTKVFSPPPISAKTTPAPSATKKRVGRAKAAPETPVPVAATPRTSRRVAAKTPSKPAAEVDAEVEPDAEDEKTPPTKKGKTPAKKSERTPAPKAEKTPAKAKAAKTPSARSKAAKAESDSPEAPSASPEKTSAPKTPSRATVTKKAVTKAPKTPATPSKASAATSSAKAAKSKAEKSAAKESTTEATSPPNGSKSAVKSSKASTAASSRRKTTK